MDVAGAFKTISATYNTTIIIRRQTAIFGFTHDLYLKPQADSGLSDEITGCRPLVCAIQISEGCKAAMTVLAKVEPAVLTSLKPTMNKMDSLVQKLLIGDTHTHTQGQD
jgi:hypothetical protein